MRLDKKPVKVNIGIETPSVGRESFYNVCFITENELAPRTLEVAKLKDLLDNGYDRYSLAYNFCVGVLSQDSLPVIYIRAKRSTESFEEAFDADDNSLYYFISIASKSLSVVESFNSHINSSDGYKLQFYSSTDEAVVGSKLVQYYQKPIQPSEVVDGNTTLNNHYLNQAFEQGYTISELDSTTPELLQQARLAYPESAWVGRCGNYFPSSVQWLYKYLAKVDTVIDKTIPYLTSTTSAVIKNKATIGSGMTNQGVPIHEQVSMDWVKWAISKRVWNTLYTQEKINATQGGLDLITNEIKVVLDLAVSESIFTEYRIKDTSLDRSTNTISVKFTANLSYTILEVELSGSLYY